MGLSQSTLGLQELDDNLAGHEAHITAWGLAQPPPALHTARPTAGQEPDGSSGRGTPTPAWGGTGRSACLR
eukprot:6591179-Prymnesium_polylepis.1